MIKKIKTSHCLSFTLNKLPNFEDEYYFIFRENAAAIHKSSPLYFGRGGGRIDMRLYGVHCRGNENTLYDCPHYSTSYHPMYDHKYDVGVACSKWINGWIEREEKYRFIESNAFNY